MTPRVERHIAAVKARLAAAMPGTPVDVGVAPSTLPPYLVIHPNAGMVARDRLCSDAGALVFRFEVEAVGTGSEQALWLLDGVRAALLPEPLEVDGAKLSLTRQIDGSRLFRDEIAQPPIYMIDAEFQAYSQTVTP